MEMMQYVTKVILTAIAVVAISELGKRSSIWGAVLASLPLTSLLAFIWLYVETGDAEKIAALSTGIFWLVIPSLALFVALTFMLRHGISFWLSFGASCAITVVAYFAMVRLLAQFDIHV